MNVYDPYPWEVTAGGRRYRLDLSYDTVLRVMDTMDEKDLLQDDRIEISLMLLLEHPRKMPKTSAGQKELLQAILALFPKGKSDGGPRYIDFHQDARLIRSAFLRMGIDLTRERIHFFKFMELLGDLPSDTALARVIDIRQRPLPKATKYNREQIQALQEAKAKVAIKYSEEESRENFMTALKNSTFLRG